MQFRIPASLFFSFLFPLIMMFAMVTSYGNVEIGGGYHFIDKYFLISTGMGIMPLSLISFPIWLGESIQNKSYKRLEYFGLNIPKIIISDVLSYLFITVLSILLNILFGFLIYGLTLPNSKYFLSFLFQCLYSNFVMFLLGASLAFLVKSTRILMPLGMTLLFTIYIFTGTLSSFSGLPKSFQQIGNFIPMKYVMNDFFNIWTEKEVVLKEFLLLNTLIGIILSCFLINLFMNSKKFKQKKLREN